MHNMRLDIFLIVRCMAASLVSVDLKCGSEK